jgi:large subunit ribosomal protein L22
MEARATQKHIRVSPQKARLVVDLIRGKNAGEALSILTFTKKRVTQAVEKVLRSAIANAEQKAEHLDVDQLVVSKAYVNDGIRSKRTRPAPMGRAYRYQRRTSHITVAVESPEEQR